MLHSRGTGTSESVLILYFHTVLCLTRFSLLNPLHAELNPICHLLALLGAHHIFHVSGLRVKCYLPPPTTPTTPTTPTSTACWYVVKIEVVRVIPFVLLLQMGLMMMMMTTVVNVECWWIGDRQEVTEVLRETPVNGQLGPPQFVPWL